MDIAACHKVLRLAAQLVRVTAECTTAWGSALAVTTQSMIYLDDAGHARNNENPGYPLARRAATASWLAAGLMATAEGQRPSDGEQAAWVAIRGCLANALTCGARVCRVGMYAPYIAQLSSEITGVAAAVAGQCISGGCVEQLFLRREEGGSGRG